MAESTGGNEETGFRGRGGNGSADEFPCVACAGEKQGTVERECPVGIHMDKADHFHLHGQQNAAAKKMESPFIQHVPPDPVLRMRGIMEILEADSFLLIPG
jgi:hypothetical protein